jgi:hypothetical protein
LIQRPSSARPVHQLKSLKSSPGGHIFLVGQQMIWTISIKDVVTGW